MKTFTVVMAGGGGTRFWPLSRKSRPKQLLNLSGRNIMLNDTIARMEPLVHKRNSYVVTNKVQEKLTKKLLLSGVPKKNVIAEPVGRNTAPCILYAALSLKKKYGDGIMCVLPADHFIAKEEEYRRVVKEAIEIANETNGLVTIGIKPTYPATGYGYIACGEAYGISSAYKVEGFKEKPSSEVATEYLQSGDYLWNSGVFVWKISAVLSAFEKYLPHMYNAMMNMYEDIGTKYEEARIEEIYPLLESISVDYGIMEKAENVYVLPGDYGWNDVGSLDALDLIYPKDVNGNCIKGDAVVIDSSNCIVSSSGKLIAVAGVDDLMVIDTEDALLVCPKSYAQNVKNIVDKLQNEGRKEI